MTRRAGVVLAFYLILLPRVVAAESVADLERRADGLADVERTLALKRETLLSKEAEIAERARALKEDQFHDPGIVSGLALSGALTDLRHAARERSNLEADLRETRRALEQVHRALYEALVERATTALENPGGIQGSSVRAASADLVQAALARSRLTPWRKPSALPADPVSESPADLRALANIYLSEAGLHGESIAPIGAFLKILRTERRLIVRMADGAGAPVRSGLLAIESLDAAIGNLEETLLRLREARTTLRRRAFALRMEADRTEEALLSER